jgi:hypothetical protein
MAAGTYFGGQGAIERVILQAATEAFESPCE